MPTKKVVLLHDWLVGFRGGERVLESFCELYPDAPIYTLIHKKGSTSPTIESREIITSWLNKIPGIHENYRFFLPLMPLAAMSLKIKHQADIVLSSSHCVIKGVKKPEGSVHVSYVHSPMRYIYDQFDSYFGKSRFPIRLAAHLVRPYLQTWDYITNANVDLFVANSTFIQSRIKLFYNRDSIVVHPFVDLKDFSALTDKPKENHFLLVSAFAPNKRVDLAIRAFRKSGKELRIIGGGSKQEIEAVKLLASENIKFLGQINRLKVVEEFAKAKALIFPGVEDFGIVPLESLAAGTPVVAFMLGGVLDTLDEKTAVYFTEPNETSLINAVNEIENKKFQRENLIQKAHKFSKEKFEYEIKCIVSGIA
jgi:glycosyltransferase involved in cell wall biosynthesis